MEKVKIELTEQQIQDLFNYLGRVNLQGSESLSFVELLNVFNQSLQAHMKEKQSNS